MDNSSSVGGDSNEALLNNGASYRFECKLSTSDTGENQIATDASKFAITWFHDDEPMMQYDDADDRDSWSLTLVNVSSAHNAGTYHCAARLGRQQIIYSQKLRVKFRRIYMFLIQTIKLIIKLSFILIKYFVCVCE